MWWVLLSHFTSSSGLSSCNLLDLTIWSLCFLHYVFAFNLNVTWASRGHYAMRCRPVVTIILSLSLSLSHLLDFWHQWHQTSLQSLDPLDCNLGLAPSSSIPRTQTADQTAVSGALFCASCVRCDLRQRTQSWSCEDFCHFLGSCHSRCFHIRFRHLTLILCISSISIRLMWLLSHGKSGALVQGVGQQDQEDQGKEQHT